MPKKSKRSNSQSWWKSLSNTKRALLIGVLLIVASLILYFGSSSHAFNQQKDDFKRLEQQMGNITLEGYGPSQDVRKECYRQSRKFEKGPIYCYIRIILPSVETSDELEQKLKLTEVFKEESIELNNEGKLNFARYTYEGSTFSYCSLDARESRHSDKYAKDTISSFECGTTIDRPIYPMRDN